MIKRLEDDAGYSLVEVIVSIMILSIAIIPMVGMFDMGLRSASTSGNYDKARAFANERLERVKTLPYAAARDSFPVSSSTPSPTATPAGSYTSSALTVPGTAGLPNGASYTVVKQYVNVDTSVTPANLQNASTDSNMLRVTVAVSWSGNSIAVSGVVAGSLA